MLSQRRNSDAVERAIERDIRDGHKLDAIHQEITELLDRLVPFASPLEHPRARWQPGDLIDALQEQNASLVWERNKLRGPVFVEDEE